MKKTIVVLCVAALIILPAAASTQVNQSIEKTEEIEFREYIPGIKIEHDPNIVYYDPDYVILTLEDDEDIDDYDGFYINGIWVPIVDKISVLNAGLIEVPSGLDPEDVINALEGMEITSFAEMNIMYSNYWTPNDPMWSQQWNLVHIKCPSAWDKTKGDRYTILAIVDSGFDYNHEDKSSSNFNGYDFVNDDNDASDDDGHGTHCAGIAGAYMNNGKGIAGVTLAMIMSVKVLNDDGDGSVWNVAEGIVYAANNDAWVISMSLGSFLPSILVKIACDYAYYVKKVLIVAASGNEYKTSVSYPAGFSSVIAVGATDSNKDRCDFSNYGAALELMAPGDNILSLKMGGGYIKYSGTSMAAPHVAGVAVLIYSRLPASKNPYKVRSILQNTAQDIGSPGKDIETGYGLVDAYAAVTASKNKDVNQQQSQNFLVNFNLLTKLVGLQSILLKISNIFSLFR